MEKQTELVLKGTEYSVEYAQKLKDAYKIFKNSGYEVSEHGLNRISVQVAEDGFVKTIIGNAKIKSTWNGHSLEDMAELYAKNVNSNGKWSWMDDFPDAGGLSKADKVDIKNLAIEKGLFPEVSVKIISNATGKTYRYADFDSISLVKEKVYLPEKLWTKTDAIQFKWINDKISG